MRREGQACYVGLLEAAALHGTMDQAVLEFQVVSNKRLPRIRAGRNLIDFCFRMEMEAVTAGIEGWKTDTGTMKISSVALTALDLLRYLLASGGIDNVATIFSDLGRKIHPEQLAAFSRLVERPVVQRLGHLLEHLGHDALTGPMLGALQARGSLPWTELDRQQVRDPDFAPEPRVSGWIMRTDTGFCVADGILRVEATRARVPAFTFETGEGGRLEEGVIDDGAVYVRNVMKIDGEPVPPEKTWVMKEFLGLRAQRGGLLLTRARLGDIVDEGELLCSIVTIYGDEVETITAPNCDEQWRLQEEKERHNSSRLRVSTQFAENNSARTPWLSQVWHPSRGHRANARQARSNRSRFSSVKPT